MQDHQEDEEGEEKTVDKGHDPLSTTLLLLQSGMGAEHLVLMASAAPWGSVTSWPLQSGQGFVGMVFRGQGCVGLTLRVLMDSCWSPVGLCDLMALE